MVGLHLDDLPTIGGREKSVDRNRAAHVAQRHVERIPLAVRVEGLLVEPIRPRSDERDAAERGPRLEFINGRIRPAKDLLTFDLHRKRQIADRRKNGYGDLIIRVFKHDRVAVSTDRVRSASVS